MGNLGVEQINSAKAQQQKKQQAKVTPPKEESVSFFDEAWSGNQIAKLTGDNVITDWLQNKDKVCTDGKDDGKLSAGQYALSFAKGLLGGIPKAIINHPVASVAAAGIGAAAVYLTGGAILPVLTAAGIIAGVGMIGYGTYKAATAEKDGEAKQALETMGMGVTTTALSVASADAALEKASEAGVKSAQVAEDANTFDKVVQVFKSIPECLTKSKEWSLSYLKGTPVNIELADGTKQVKVKGKLTEETVVKDNKTSVYKNGQLAEEILPDGTHRYHTVKGDKYMGTKWISTEYRPDEKIWVEQLSEYNNTKGSFTRVLRLDKGASLVIDNTNHKVIASYKHTSPFNDPEYNDFQLEIPADLR